ncbi:MAG: FG-GAP repeat domain-containing protein [Planctomycetota bacterium]|jgi:hypothetical protein
MRNVLIACALMGLATPVTAQSFGNAWVTFEKQRSALSAGEISSSSIETDMHWGDLDKDGFTDAVIVRKQPFTTAGKRTNILLMNENGVLTDRTLEYASASDVGGDQGFLTPTNDRDVVVVDVDGDGWLDVVTATTVSSGEPKHIGHPRIYMNLGEDGGGNWLGLEYQDARFPQLFNFSSGQPQNPDFCGVEAGDIDGDGLPELYFIDYGSMDDRLLYNVGNGFFADESQIRMTAQMLESAFGTSGAMHDMNGDGTIDVVKDTTLFSPQYVAIIYNNLKGLTSDGMFNNFQNSGVGSGAPYHVDVGDLNADGRMDIITSDDGSDRYRFNLGNDALGRAEFSGGSGGHPYDFISGGDDGFAGTNLIVDLDNDGWADTVYSDVDVDISGFNRRLHIYHNTGSETGAQPGDIVTLREERENSGSGWLGVEGMHDADMRGTYDVAVFDIDNDGWKDMVVSRSAGTDVWINLPSEHCQTNLGHGGPGTMSMSLCGEELDDPSKNAVLNLMGGVPSSPVFLPMGFVNDPTPFKGGILVPTPPALIFQVFTDSNGAFSLPVSGTPGPLVTIYLQAAIDNAGTWEFSNALEIEFGG